MKYLFPRLLLVIALLCAGTSFAQTLINQSGISSFPYVISTPGSYKLSSNITVTTPGVNAINIDTSNVTLDLNGFTISGPYVCNANGCTGSSNSVGVLAWQGDTVVQNGFIKGFFVGTELQMGIVQNINVSSSYYGIYASEATVRVNTTTSCAWAGIYAFNSVVTENTSTQNGSMGIMSEQSSVINNIATYNVGYGLLITSGPYTGNTFNGNGTDVAPSGSATSSKNNSCTNAAC
jgi:hypothetical protein